MFDVDIIDITYSALTSFLILLLIKNINTFNQEIIINNAIREYHLYKIEKREYDYEVEYNDMKSYEKTLLDLTDWGCKNILPPHKYKVIESFIKINKR